MLRNMISLSSSAPSGRVANGVLEFQVIAELTRSGLALRELTICQDDGAAGNELCRACSSHGWREPLGHLPVTAWAMRGSSTAALST